MGERGGGEEKGRPDTKPFRKSCDTSKIWIDRKNIFIDVLISYGTFMDRDVERNSKRL